MTDKASRYYWYDLAYDVEFDALWRKSDAGHSGSSEHMSKLELQILLGRGIKF